MHSFYHNYLFPAVTCLIFASCTKNINNGGTGPGPKPPPPGPPLTPDSTVYIAGYNGANAILWKNGIPDTLSTTLGLASQVLVSGNDVYVAGIYQGIFSSNSGGLQTGQYVYWKNGVANNIDTIQAIADPPAISVSGTDIYYANGKGWKNGAPVVFPAIGSRAVNFFPGSIVSTFANGADIYFAGYDTLENVVSWKNGDLTIAAPYRGRGSTLPLVYCMYVSGNDVYLGGMFNQAVYWKNGTANFMQPRTDDAFIGSINSLFVSGTDVYNPGEFIQINLPPGVYLGASYWKNGVENDLQLNHPADAYTSYATTSVFVSGSDLYVSGYSSTFTSPTVPLTDSAVYWKNGIEYSLHTPGRANSIYVQQH